MKKISFFAIGLYLALAMGIAPVAFGDELIETAPLFNGSTAGNLTLGFSFTVGSNALDVSALGVWNANWATSGATLASDHFVGIWDSSGKLVGSTTLVAGTGTLVGEYLYTNLSTPITLSANTQYYIGVSYDASNVDAWGAARTEAVFSNAATNFFATLIPAPNSAPTSGGVERTGVALSSAATNLYAALARASNPAPTTDALIGPGSIYGAPNLMFKPVPVPGAKASLRKYTKGLVSVFYPSNQSQN